MCAVATNLIRVRRPTPSVCPEGFTGRSYLGIIDGTTNMVALRYVDGEIVETLATQPPVGFVGGTSAPVSGFRHHDSADDIVVFAATASIGGGIAMVTWNITTGNMVVVRPDASAITTSPVYDGAGNIVWGIPNVALGQFHTFSAPIGSSLVYDPDFDMDGTVDLADGTSFSGLISLASGEHIVAFLEGPETRQLVVLPSGPPVVTSPALPVNAISPRRHSAGGALGSYNGEAGIFKVDGTFTRWTPEAWGDEYSFPSVDISPSGGEWLLRSSLAGTQYITRLPSGPVADGCPQPLIEIEKYLGAFNPQGFFCRD